MSAIDALKIVGALALAVGLIAILYLRRKSHRRFLNQFSEAEVCGHLKPALELLKSRGHTIVRAGQQHPDFPLEIHVAPRFDPAAVYAELNLQPPVHVSDRNVLYCKEDWCELHPKRA